MKPWRNWVYDRISGKVAIEQGHPGQVSRTLANAIERGALGKLIKKFFAPRLEGREYLPKDRSCLIVSNNFFSDPISNIWLVLNLKLGSVSPMAHPVLFFIPGIKKFLKESGAIPSSYHHAAKVLKKGVHVCVHPGGEYECFRPIWKASQVDFGGRKGFLRLARESWVPILPMSISGAHIMTPMIWRSKLLCWLLIAPKLMGSNCWGLSVLGVIGVFLILVFVSPYISLSATVLMVICWLSSPLPFIPIFPSRVRNKFSPLIEPAELFGPRDSDPTTIDYNKAYDKVVAVIQNEVAK